MSKALKCHQGTEVLFIIHIALFSSKGAKKVEVRLPGN